MEEITYRLVALDAAGDHCDLMQIHEGRDVGTLGVRLLRETAALFAEATHLRAALRAVVASLIQPVQFTNLEACEDIPRLRGAVGILRVDAAGAVAVARRALAEAEDGA